jgi:hypothetical protein
MSKQAPDLRLCDSATLFRPPSRANFKVQRNTEIILYTGGKRFAESQSRNGLALERPKRGLRSEYAESALGPSRHGSFRAMRFPEARGNSRHPVLALLRAAEVAPGRPRGALGAAVGDAGPPGGTSLPPRRVRRDTAYPWRRRVDGAAASRRRILTGGMVW